MRTIDRRRFVVISDLHAHPWAAFAKGDGAENTRLRRTLAVLNASLAKAKELGCPWLFGGDLVHTAGYSLNVVLAALADVLGRYPDVPKLAVWGNHDARGVGGRITIEQTVWAALRRAVPGLFVLDARLEKLWNDEIHGVSFSGAGAQPRMDLFEYAEPSDVGLYHGTVKGTRGPNGHVFEEGLDPDELFPRHRVSVVGDVHHPQMLNRAGRLILIPGAPEHHNFGDVGQHGWSVVTLPDHGEHYAVSTEFVLGGSPEFRTVDAVSDVRDDGHFYRVRAVAAGEALPEGAVAIVPSPTAVRSRDLLRGAEPIVAWLRAEPPDGEIPRERYLEAGRALLEAQEGGQLADLRLTRLHLHNFCSYADQTLDVRPGTWLVVGKGRDYPSNGAGKSTLFEALFWLLFGRTTKGLSGDEVIRWGAETCVVLGIFTAPDGSYLSVQRDRGTHGARLTVAEYARENAMPVRWEAASVNEMTEKLTRRLGVTPALFQALGYFSQERLLLFASATDGERKDMLADLLGLGAYQAAAAAAGVRIASVDGALSLSTALEAAAIERAERERTRLEDRKVRQLEWMTAFRRRAEEAERAHATFVAERVNYFDPLFREALARLTAGLDERVARLQERRAETKRGLESTRRLVPPETLAKVRGTFMDAHSIAYTANELVAETERFHAKMKQQREQQVVSLAQGMCPTCDQPITKEHRERCLLPIEKELHAAWDRVVEARVWRTGAVEEAAKAKLALERAEAGHKQWLKDEEEHRVLKQIETDLRAAEKERAGLEDAAQRHVNGVLDAKARELRAAVESARKERNPYAEELAATVTRVKEAEAEAEAQREAQQDAAAERAVMAYWQRGFSKQGIQSLLVDEMAVLFNAERGSILPALTQGVYDVQFSTQSQTKAGERRERTEFQVYERGQPVPYAALSGGQRRRIDVGVMLTLVKAVSRWARVPGALGVLVLDEVFGFLDAAGAEGLMEALREVQEVVPAIYVIAHDPQLQALFPGVVRVEQGKDGASRIADGEEEARGEELNARVEALVQE